VIEIKVARGDHDERARAQWLVFDPKKKATRAFLFASFARSPRLK